MNHILERLELLERRVSALEAGVPPAPTVGLAPERGVAPSRATEIAPAVVVAAARVPTLPGDTLPPAAEPDAGRRHAVSTPLLPSAPPLNRLTPAEPRAARPPRDLESWVGAVVLGRVGIAAVVLAAAYFAQLAYKHVGDTAKVLSLYALGGALVAAGSVLRARVGPKYVALLWGGAVAVTYIAGLAATLRYEIVDPWTGVALLAAAAGLGQLLARSLRQQAIATVSIAGAMCAPFLLGVAQSHGPWLLVYAAGVHAWAAWTERAWGWTWARYAGIAGTLALGVTWSYGPCLGDVAATFVALHVYALAAMAPELLTVWRGGAPRSAVVWTLLGGVAWLDATLLIHELLRGLVETNVRGGGLMAGPAWLGLAFLLAARTKTPQARFLVRGLAGLGGIVLAIGAVLVWDEPKVPWGPLASLAALAPALLLLRRRVDAGDAGVVTAGILSLVLGVDAVNSLVSSDARTIAADALGTFPLLLLALIPAAALAGFGRTGALRATGLLLGAATLAFPFTPPHLDSAAWAALGLALPALWTLFGHERARRTGDAVLAAAAEVLAIALAATWVLGVTALGRVHGWPNAFDPFTWSALAIAGVLLTIRLRPVPGRKAPNVLAALMAGAVGVLLLAGGREVHLLTREFPPADHSAALALFAAAAGLGLVVHARLGDRLGRAATGIACLGAGAVLVLAQGLDGASGTPFLLGLLGVGAATGVSTEVLLRRRDERPAWLGLVVAPLLVLGFAWFAAAHLAPHAPAEPVWNHRFLAGFGLTLLLAGSTWSTIRANGPQRARWYAGVAALVVGYLSGLFELVQATRPLAGAWAPVLVSLYTAAFGAAMLVGGFAWSLRPLRLAALVVFGAVVGKVGLHDLRASDLPLRVLVTGVLGLVLLGSAYAYARRRRAAATTE